MLVHAPMTIYFMRKSVKRGHGQTWSEDVSQELTVSFKKFRSIYFVVICHVGNERGVGWRQRRPSAGWSACKDERTNSPQPVLYAEAHVMCFLMRAALTPRRGPVTFSCQVYHSRRCIRTTCSTTSPSTAPTRPRQPARRYEHSNPRHNTTGSLLASNMRAGRQSGPPPRSAKRRCP